MKKEQFSKIIQEEVKKILNEQKGKPVKIYHYLLNKMMDATMLNKPFKNDDGDLEVGIQFKNGDKAYAIYDTERKRWELGEGDYLGESKQNNSEQKVRSLIKEIINNMKNYTPYSGNIINNTCEICGLPENACEHGEDNFINKKDNNKIAKVSGMQQLKEMIKKEVRSLLKESLIKSINDLKINSKYKIDSNMGGSLDVIYKGIINDKYKFISISWFNKGEKYFFSKDEVLKKIHNINSSIYKENLKEGRKSHRQKEYESVYGKPMNKNLDIEPELQEIAPPGMEHVVKALKNKKGVDNPYKVAWSMYNKKHGKK